MRSNKIFGLMNRSFAPLGDCAPTSRRVSAIIDVCECTWRQPSMEGNPTSGTQIATSTAPHNFILYSTVLVFISSMSSKTSLILLSTALLAHVDSTSGFVASAPSIASSRRSMTEDVSEAETTPTTPLENEEMPIYFNILTEQSPVVSTPVVSEPELSPAALAASAAVASSYEQAASLNGWTPKEDYALWGLPGAIAPLGFFDPIGFAREGTPLNDAKRLREAEVQHGRVAMLATVGYLSQELMNTVGGGPFHIDGPANDQLQQVPAIPFAILTAFIGSLELYRAKTGWVEPKFRIGSKTLWTLRDNYYPVSS